LPVNAGVFNYDLMTMFGLINLLLSGLGILIAIILLLVRNRKNELGPACSFRYDVAGRRRSLFCFPVQIKYDVIIK
jgi:hypothetical protein